MAAVFIDLHSLAVGTEYRPIVFRSRVHVIVINRSRGLYSRYISTLPEGGVAYISTKARGCG